LTDESPWRRSWRADPAARRIADRHYNRQKVGAAQFVPPGRCLVLLTHDRSALWVTSWPFAEFVKHRWAGAWVNSLFRREGGDYLASDLIRWAVAHTRAEQRDTGNWAEWPHVPDLGMVTFVDPGEIASTNPGFCYLQAGWERDGYTEGGLPALRERPDRMPAAAPVPSDQLDLWGAA